MKFLTGPDVEVLFRRAVLVEVVGDGVGLVVRVGDATDVPEPRRPARAVAVPAREWPRNRKRNHSHGSEMDTSRVEGTATLQNAEIMPVQMFGLFEDDDVVFVRRDVTRDVVKVEDAT